MTIVNPNRVRVIPAAMYIYGDKARLAAERGWSEDEQRRHIEAIERWNSRMGNPQDEDDMGITHPYNYLTESEVES